jgi:hypothetical protein
LFVGTENLGFASKVALAPFASKMKLILGIGSTLTSVINSTLFQRNFLPNCLRSRMDQLEEAYHDKTDSRDSCIGAIPDGAAGSNH